MQLFLYFYRSIEKIANDNNLNNEDTEEDDINVDDEDDIGTPAQVTSVQASPKKPSIFSVSSLLSNDSPSSLNKPKILDNEREQDEITSDILPNMKNFLYPGLTLDMLAKGPRASPSSPVTPGPEPLFPRNLPNPFAFGASLFPGNHQHHIVFMISHETSQHFNIFTKHARNLHLQGAREVE